MKVLLLGRFFVFAPLAEWFICGEYIRYRYLGTLRKYLERNFNGVLAMEVAGIDWTRRPLIGDLLNIRRLSIKPPSNID